MTVIIDQSILETVYPQRSPGAHKGDYGHLLVVAGSFRYTGAPVLVARAALRAGVDRVTVAAPRRAADAVAAQLPDASIVPLEGGVLAPENVGPLKKEFEKKTAIVIGNGLGREQRTLRAIRLLLKDCDIPLVLDADALYAVSEDPSVLDGRRVVLTPHAHEFTVLSENGIHNQSPSRIPAMVQEYARESGTTLLLKRHHDIIVNAEETLINETGNAYMTVGGTGDVLAGVVGAFAARGVALLNAAAAGAYLTGLAGDRAAEQYAEGLIASDVVEALPRVLVEE